MFIHGSALSTNKSSILDRIAVSNHRNKAGIPLIPVVYWGCYLKMGATWFRRDDEDHWLHVVFSQNHFKKLDAYYKWRI